jgi:hypothetical protein
MVIDFETKTIVPVMKQTNNIRYSKLKENEKKYNHLGSKCVIF